MFWLILYRLPSLAMPSFPKFWPVLVIKLIMIWNWSYKQANSASFSWLLAIRNSRSTCKSKMSVSFYSLQYSQSLNRAWEVACNMLIHVESLNVVTICFVHALINLVYSAKFMKHSCNTCLVWTFTFIHTYTYFQVALVVKNLPASAGDLRDTGLSPGLGKAPGEGHGNPLQYSCLESPVDRGAWCATVHRVAKSWTRLKWLSMHESVQIRKGICSILCCRVLQRGTVFCTSDIPYVI